MRIETSYEVTYARDGKLCNAWLSPSDDWTKYAAIEKTAKTVLLADKGKELVRDGKRVGIGVFLDFGSLSSDYQETELEEDEDFGNQEQS